MNRTWKVVDVVRLKSGGPRMTVVFPGDVSTEVRCAWFVGNVNGDFTEHGGHFPAEALEDASKDLR